MRLGESGNEDLSVSCPVAPTAWGLSTCKGSYLEPSQGVMYLIVLCFLLRLNSWLHLMKQCYLGAPMVVFKVFEQHRVL